MKNLIVKYLSEEATEENKYQLLEWLRSDENHKKIFSDIYDIWLASDKSYEDNLDINKAFKRFKASTNLLERNYEQRNVYKMPLTRLIVAASIIIAIFSIGSFFLGKSFINVENQVVNNVIMGKNSKGSVTLPDGTTVWLNSDSRLYYPQNFSKEERLVRLEGEGYFDVVSNPDRPFYVETDGLKIRVLGTKFDVKDYKNRETMEATLLSGKVEVFVANSNNGIILKPNQKIIYNKQLNTYSIDKLDAYNQIIWIEDRLIFSNEKFADVLKKIEYWYGIEIICDDKVDLDQKLSFTIRRESKEEIFELISLITPIKVEIDKESIKIQKK